MSETLTIVNLSLDADLVAQDGPLAAMQAALVSRLEAEDHYTGVSLLYENRLDILAEIELAIAQIGIAVVIMTPAIDDESPNIPRPILDAVTIIAQVTENPVINRAATGLRIPGGTIAWRVATDLACTSLEGALLIHKSMRQVIDEDNGTLVWNVTFQHSLNI